MSRKGQIQISESIFIVIFILLIIVFGIVFYSGAKKDDIVQKRSEFAELESIEVAQIASSLSEVQCSFTNDQEPSCFEKERLDAFVNVTNKETLLTREYYVSRLGDALIEIEEIYPGNETWTLYNNTLPNGTRYSGLPVIIPVSLYQASMEEYHYGILRIVSYQKSY